MANTASQNLNIPNKNSGKEKTEGAGVFGNGEQGDHTSSPKDGQPTQFAIPQRDKVPSAVPETL